MPHLITDIALTSSVEGDTTALAAIAERQTARDVLPSSQASHGQVATSTGEAE